MIIFMSCLFFLWLSIKLTLLKKLLFCLCEIANENEKNGNFLHQEFCCYKMIKIKEEIVMEEKKRSENTFFLPLSLILTLIAYICNHQLEKKKF